jgi:hypothetical protein
MAGRLAGKALMLSLSTMLSGTSLSRTFDGGAAMRVRNSIED